MAIVTLQMTDKDLAGFLRSLFDLGAEARVQIMIHLKRRPKQADLPMELVWEVEVLPSNGDIYRNLLEEGDSNEDLHGNQGRN